MLKIALNDLGGSQWTGGITYRNNLIKALQLYDPNMKLYFLSIAQELDNNFQNLIPVRIQTGASTDRIINKVFKKFLNYDYLLAKSTSGLKLDVVFPHSLRAGKNTKSIYWIPDFQFVHLPHLYSNEQIDGLKKRLPKYFDDAKLVVVSSQDAGNDFKKFAPEYNNKVRVMRFVAHVPLNLYNENPEKISSIYHLPTDFIYLPNQFWAHKNHKLVLEALRILKIEKIEPKIVCTGNPTDIRNPVYLAEILQMIAEYGLHKQFIILGLIPHQHVYWLIRQSKCVLNPSLFEGWSTSVEESKSVGKRMILSDLEVHKEQNPENSLYFDRYSADDLAQQLQTIWDTVPSGPDIKMEEKAKALLPERMRAFAQRFIEICEEAKTK